ncbi:MFS general substrate transporter [Amniculicola lignicola CBS 123094]|uniref:MFS general substrate transporter n=1 Tax=Amniculicola lignicola CBS 123094 TaxID=1392246 RepID=A0A6A5W7S3_9PLEO|nr:MFS general substrate transporter [Amniculicola lignicola CBS 123094]
MAETAIDKSRADENGESGDRKAPAVVSNVSPMRLHFIIAGLWLSIFMSALDGTIISTGLVKISSDFKALGASTWLVTAYLLTYNSFLMILARLSDIWGLKAALLASNIIFLIFSMACGGAQSMNQLIVFRALQGIGGSGQYSLVFVAIMKLITPEKMGFYSGIISSVFALANLLGPILGGVIVDHTTWRWIFFINGPIVAAASILLFFSFPASLDKRSQKERFQGFDGIGGILSICWPIPLLFALQEGGARLEYGWNGGIIIGTLTAGLAGLILFGVYEAWISIKTSKNPIFPVHFVQRPEVAFLLLSQFFAGVPFYVSIIQLPQRFQGVNNTSAERAGILLLPLTLLTPVGSMTAGLAIGKFITAEVAVMVAATCVSIGVGLISSLPTGSAISAATYGYQIITGFGLGLGAPPYYMLLASSVAEKDVSIGTGTLNMLRTLGGCVGVAICSALHHSTLNSKLPSILTPEQIADVNESIAHVAAFPTDIREQTRHIFGSSYRRQFQAMIAFALANLLSSFALAYFRKRAGVYGIIPERKEANEFHRAVEEENELKVADEGAVIEKDDSTHEKKTEVDGEEKHEGQSDQILAIPKEVKI